MIKMNESRRLWTLAIDHENNTLRYRMLSEGSIAWEFSHSLSALVEELNRKLGEIALHGNDQENRKLLRDIGNVLYGLMVPGEVRERMPPKDSFLLLSTRAQNFHYELIHDGEDFWGCKYALGRQLVGYQPLRSAVLAQCETPRCLMMANPSEDLPEAEREAAQLMESLMRQGVDCQYMAREQVTSTEIMMQFNSGRYDIIHYSGHIGLEAKGDATFVLAGGQYFRLKEITGLVGFGHPFVFLNGCGDLLSGSENRNGYIYEGIVAPFIYAGACAVVGTRWKVDDTAARRFAESFYVNFLRGMPVGEALSKARQDACREGGCNDWTAFILFGNPCLYQTNTHGGSAQEPYRAVHTIKSFVPSPEQKRALARIKLEQQGSVDPSMLSADLYNSLEIAWCESYRRYPVSTTHWFIGFMLCGGIEAERLFGLLHVDPKVLGYSLATALDFYGPAVAKPERIEKTDFTSNLKNALEKAIQDASGRARKANCYDLLTAIMEMDCSIAETLEPLGMDLDAMKKAIGCLATVPDGTS